MKVIGGIRKGVSALYEHLAEDALMHWVVETESQLQEMWNRVMNGTIPRITSNGDEETHLIKALRVLTVS